MTDADEMCPNCVTPWKCNGPHVVTTDRGTPAGTCFQQPFEQHPVAWTWRTHCSCGFIGHWRGSPDRAQEDYTDHANGNDNGGHR